MLIIFLVKRNPRLAPQTEPAAAGAVATLFFGWVLRSFTKLGVIPKAMNISIEDIYKGCFPFILCDLVVLALLVIFPGIALWLPNLLM